MAARKKPIVDSGPEIIGATPVFFRTRVPVDTLFDWLEPGYTLDYYLENSASGEARTGNGSPRLIRQDTRCEGGSFLTRTFHAPSSG